MRALPLVVALLLAAVPAGAGVIRGQLQVPARPAASAPAANAYPGHAHSMPGMRAPQRGLVEDAVVYVERVPAAVDSALARAPAPRARLAQQDQTFVPRVVAVPVGGQVDFPNQDPIYHNVFSFSPARRFDLGKYPRGASRSVRFPKPGVVNVYCDIHSDMAAFVLVVPNRAFARPDAEGAFALPPLPPGAYTLVTWHPDLGTFTRSLTLPEQGDLSIALSY